MPHNHSRRGILCLLGASLAAPAVADSPGTSVSLEEIISRHTAALGGMAALEAVRSKKVDLQIIENGQVAVAHYRCNKQPAFRIDIYDKGRHVFCEGLDAKGPWIWPPDAPIARQGVPDARRTGIEGIEFNLYGLSAFPALGNKLAFDGREPIEGINYYVIRADLKDSYQTFLYIDPNSWMIARRRDFRANHPDLKPAKQKLETQYSDFRRVNGIANAFLQHQVDLSDGKIIQVQIVDGMEYNPAADDAVPDRSHRADSAGSR